MCIRFISRIVILLFPAILLFGNSEAQVAFHNFNSNDGLPSNEVYCVFQDHDGFLWYGTDHGVVKYNGYSFKTFTTADGLTDNTILDIKGDEDNQIWFLTLSGGMCYFDGRRFAAHPNNDTIKKLFDKRLPTSCEVLKNKQIWFGFVELGIAKVDTDQMILFAAKSPHLFNDTIPHHLTDTVHLYLLRLTPTKYIYTTFLIYKMPPVNDPQIQSFEVYNICIGSLPINDQNINLIPLTNTKSLLLSKANYLVYIDSNKNIHTKIYPTNNPILKLNQTQDRKVWMFQKNNIGYSIDVKKDHIDIDDSLKFAINASNLFLDIQGNQWVTTLDKGIYLVPNRNIKMFNKNGIPISYKISCLNSNSKNIYAALPEGKLLKIDSNFNSYIYNSAGISKSPSSISSITFKMNGDPQSNLDPSFEWFRELDFYRTKVLQLDEQNFLVGMVGGFGLLTKDKKVLFRSWRSGFSKRVTEICKISPRKILIGTLSGLYYFEPDQNYKITKDSYFENTRITSAKSLNTDVYGVATRGRGVVLSIKNKFYRLSEEQGIISDLAEDLYFENDSVLWIAGFKRISKIYFKPMGDSLITRIKNYTKEDGLCSNQINGITGFNGFIWLATNEGLCYFRPRDLSEETVLIPLYFGNISVNGIKQSLDNLTLSHDGNNIYIEFNALYYKAIQGIRYKIRLKGTGPWKYTDLNYIQYFSLPPGEYQFEVAADDKDGKYKSDIHTLKFTIKPRFADTVFFKILVGIVILMIAGLIVSSIFSYQKLKSTNIIKLLQAEFKALSYQINPHFIFNVLNSIQYYILKKDTDNAVQLLGSFSLLIRRIVNNSRQQYIGIIEEVECLKEYMDLEKMRLDNKFEYSINIDSTIDIEDKNILPMIIQPLVENSIWHGIVPSAKPGIISVNFKKTNNTVICTVEDNGVGINATINKEKSQNNLSLAMKNVSERLKIISELNDSSWAIKTEDKSTFDPSLSGTIVTIVFPALKDKT